MIGDQSRLFQRRRHPKQSKLKETDMKKILSACFIFMWLGSAFTPAQTQNQDPSNPPQAVVSEAITLKATVEKVEPRRRVVILKDADGNTIRLKLGKEEAQNLNQLHKGDQVTANYYRSAAMMLAKPGQEPTGRSVEQFVLVPNKGATPGKVIVNTIQ